MRWCLPLIFLSTITLADGLFTPGYSLNEPDKQLHFIAGAVASIGVNMLLRHHVPELPAFPRALAGWLAASLIGLGKEVIDGRVDLKDIHATQLGGAAASVIILPFDWF